MNERNARMMRELPRQLIETTEEAVRQVSEDRTDPGEAALAITNSLAMLASRSTSPAGILLNTVPSIIALIMWRLPERLERRIERRDRKLAVAIADGDQKRAERLLRRKRRAQRRLARIQARRGSNGQ